MKKNTFLGISGDQCCILKTHLSFEEIANNLSEIEADDFIHISTNWAGCDNIYRTIDLEKLTCTGRKVALPEPIEFDGEDYDMGHKYEWSFSVQQIAEVQG